ncbi:MAG: fused MFS/spermidine synthase [Acidobacteria bacterium]|nr:fused MFS/spermidine synthase [Acidobacteriota bacterium]MCG3192115.1 Polyamine aminopropyltransferase [Thermoanaerobaculia bacterium]
MPVLGAVFLGTGASGLLCEQIFEKLLGTLLGASTPAAAVVLSVYFAGLTAGSAAYKPIIRMRRASPLLVYAVAEVAVAVWAALLWLFFDDLPGLFSPLLSAGWGSFWALQALRGLVAVIWLFPPTFAMGVSFPAIVGTLERTKLPETARRMSVFYTLNLAGAFLAAVVGPYVLFPRVGVHATLLGVILLDALAAGLGIWLLRRSRVRVPVEGEAARVPLGTAPNDETPDIPVLLIAVCWLSGFLLFSLEVIWTHLLTAVIGNSVYSFATMLATVLLGLALGGTFASGFRKKAESLDPAWVAIFFLAASIALSLSHSRWPHIPGSFSKIGPWIDTFWKAEAARWVQAAIQILPAGIILGIVYPMLFRLSIFPRRQPDRVAGFLGAVNAVGCILGALSTAYFLIPAAGTELLLVLVTLAYALAGCAVGMRSQNRRVRFATGAIAAAAVVIGAGHRPWDLRALTSGEHVYFRPQHVSVQTKLVFFHEDSYGGITTVVSDTDASGERRTLLTNGKFQGNNTGEMAAQTGITIVPALFCSNFDRALVVGLGTGRSAYVAEALEFVNVDVAEIAPGIVHAARQWFGEINGNVLSRPGVHLYVEDGRNLLFLSPLSYDLITVEISSIWFSGATNLYSRQFYEQAQRRLRPGGVLQQWVQLHHISPRSLLSVIGTVRSVFPYVSLWFIGSQGVVVASQQPQAATREGLGRIVSASAALGFAPVAPGAVPAELLRVRQTRLLSPEEVDRVLSRESFVLNTDENRYLEYATPPQNAQRTDTVPINIKFLREAARPTPVAP